MNNIFNPYLDVIKKAVNKDPKSINRLYSNSDSDFDLSYIKDLRAELPTLKNMNESVQLMKGLGTPSIVNDLPSLGCHPNFSHLRGTQETENHWIIAGFVDVKKSTQLFNRFTKATVALITEGIIKASIFAVNLCGGYVHRIQGDGLMVYFGGRGIEKLEATKNALKAFSLISYFVKNDLKEYFETNGIKEIHTRAAIDLGHDNQVLWLYSGLGEAGEVTTCSLYTSLVPKMQSNAVTNGIVVGQHIVSQLSKDKYFNKKSKPIWDFEDGRYYYQFDFDWERYIVDNDLAVQNYDGKLFLKTESRTTNFNPINLAPIAEKSKPYFDF
ncbi:hypothetical protein [uncultured Tenacibaculum sp.]|uniref:hypothetical protein n=1 Tax=uncultured Tenacibaculum sp. TaxID=174713 RepID=UPI002634A933|nr:hypothetical protein [uncultured Tenacibaculum sp.]